MPLARESAQAFDVVRKVGVAALHAHEVREIVAIRPLRFLGFHPIAAPGSKRYATVSPMPPQRLLVPASCET
jgi:hypothetical protein